jgi:hypothetical protein
MITQRKMKLSCTKQQAVIGVLLSVDEPDLAARLGRCMTAHRSRHSGAGRPFSCQSAACVWCRRAMFHGWWVGICDWAEAASSLAILSIDLSVGLFNAARHLRRAMRDVRDRVARRRNPWRNVRFAGIVGGDRRAMVLVSHEGINRSEVQDVLRRRWPDVLIKKRGQEEPTWEMLPGDAAQLGRSRRGVEPLRVVIMPQQEHEVTTSSVIDSIPVLLG